MGNVSEKIRQALVSPAFWDAGWLVGGGTFRAGISFLANLVLVWLLVPEDFGRFAIIQADISLVGAILNSQTHSLLIQAPEEELEPRNLSRYTGALIAETVLVCAGAIGTLWVFDLLTIGAVILLATSLASSWISTEFSLFERSFEYKRIAYIETSAHFISRLLPVLGAYFGLGPIVLYLRKTIKQTLLFEGVRRFGKLTSLPIRWLTLDDWRAYVQRWKGFWADGLLERVFGRAVIMTIGGLAGEETTGHFYQARRLAITPNQILRPFSRRMTFNYFSNKIERKDRYRVLKRGLTVGGGVLASVVAATLLLADPVIPWLFGQKWAPVVPMLQVMSGVIIGFPMLNGLQSYFKSQNRMGPFIVWVRSVQYLMVTAAAGAVLVTSFGAGLLLPSGLSASYLGGAAVAWIIASHLEKTRSDQEDLA